MARKVEAVNVAELFAHARNLQTESAALHMQWRQAIAEKRIADAAEIRREFCETCTDYYAAQHAAQEAAICDANRQMEKPGKLRLVA